MNCSGALCAGMHVDAQRTALTGRRDGNFSTASAPKEVGLNLRREAS
jgi:hypothetical protein